LAAAGAAVTGQVDDWKLSQISTISLSNHWNSRHESLIIIPEPRFEKWPDRGDSFNTAYPLPTACTFLVPRCRKKSHQPRPNRKRNRLNQPNRRFPKIAKHGIATKF
jgi:hypothetical protein